MEFEELNKLAENEINTNHSNLSFETEIPMQEEIGFRYDSDPEIKKGQIITRLRLKSKILTYKDKFPDELKVYDFKMENLDNLPTEDLETFLEEVKIAVRQRNSASMTKSFYFGSITLIEKVGSKFNFDVTGLSRVLYGQSEIHKCLDEIALEYEDNLQMPAHIRLPYLTFQTMLSLHQSRKTETIIKTELKKNIRSDLKDEYKDL